MYEAAVPLEPCYLLGRERRRQVPVDEPDVGHEHEEDDDEREEVSECDPPVAGGDHVWLLNSAMHQMPDTSQGRTVATPGL